MKITMTKTGYLEKQKSETIGMIHKTGMETVELDFKELAERIQKGYMYIGCLFNGKSHSGEDVISSSILTLDSDDGKIDFNQFIEFCRGYSILPNIIYRTWSDTKQKNKFHAIWNVGECNLETMKSIQKLVYFTFKMVYKEAEIDKKSYNPVQLWNGTNKETLYFGEHFLNLYLIESIIVNHASNKNEVKMKNKGYTFAGIKQLVYQNQFNYDKVSNIGNIVNQNGEILRVEREVVNFTNNDYGDANSDMLLKNCQLMRELLTSKYSYYTHELNFSVLTNLVHVKNGKQIYENFCKINGSKKDAKYAKDFNFMKGKKNGFAMPCKKFCPYADTCKYGNKNMAVAAKNTGYKTNTQNIVKTIPLEEAEAKLKDIMKNSISEHEKLYKKNLPNTMIKRMESAKTVDIIEVGTGIGKTHNIIEVIKNNSKIYIDFQKQGEKKVNLLSGYIYAAPTHKLAKQTYDDLIIDENVRKMDIVYIIPRPTAMDEDVENIIKDAENNGLYEISNDIQKKYYKDLKYRKLQIEENAEEAEEEYSKILKYLDEVKKWLECRVNSLKAKIIICTHAYLATIDLKKYNNIDIIFIDEDILDSLTNQVKIKMSKIHQMRRVIDSEEWLYYNKPQNFDDLKNICDDIIKSEDNKLYTYNSYSRLYYEKSKKKTDGIPLAKIKAISELKREYKINFSYLLNIRGFYKNENYLNIQTMKTINLYDKKTIVFSATPGPAKLYEKVFNSLVKITSVDYAEYQGELLQYSELSCFKKELEDLDYVAKIDNFLLENEITDIITFKNEKDKEESLNLKDYNEIVMTFGATAGLNDLKGKNFAVIGTYYINPMAVNLMNTLFFNDGDINEISMIKNYKIDFKGEEQLIPTFEEGVMRDYHIWKTWETMEQAVGRGRLVRTDAKVYLLCKLKHPLAIQKVL
jgi:hypothetical protein